MIWLNNNEQIGKTEGFIWLTVLLFLGRTVSSRYLYTTYLLTLGSTCDHWFWFEYFLDFTKGKDEIEESLCQCCTDLTSGISDRSECERPCHRWSRYTKNSWTRHRSGLPPHFMTQSFCMLHFLIFYRVINITNVQVYCKNCMTQFV